MKVRVALAAAVVSVCSLAAVVQQSQDEQTVWQLEHSYWEYVKAQDLASYKTLWHDNFVGWPSFSQQPVRKEHIGDWMTSYGARELHLKSYTLTPAASQATDNLVVVHYRINMVWAEKNGAEKPEALRITHTWLRGDRGWQIISGMSMRETDREK
jgi:ketosteroid isomerase-like protein